jgi:hypothetical protein
MREAIKSCSLCHHYETAGVSCSCEYLIDSKFNGYRRIPISDNSCHECGCRAGGIHHRHCTSEICPNCGGGLMECECLLTYFTALNE